MTGIGVKLIQRGDHLVIVAEGVEIHIHVKAHKLVFARGPALDVPVDWTLDDVKRAVRAYLDGDDGEGNGKAKQ